MLSTLLREAGRVLLSLAIIVASVAVIVIAAVLQREPPKPDRSPQEVKVEVTAAKRESGSFDFEVDGVVVPFREVNVAAEVSGRVTYKSTNCRAGAPVREGDLLFRIDDREYQLEIQRLEESVEQAEGARDELDVEEENAAEQIQLASEELKIRQRELARYENAADPSVFAQSEIDAAKRNELVARNALQSRRDQLQLIQSRKRRTLSAIKTARTSLERARLDLERCEVRARITGVIVSESVQQEGFVQKGGVLMTIRDTSKMEVRCNLRIQELQWLWESQAVEETLADGDGNPRPDDGSLPTSLPTPPNRAQRGYRFPETSADVLFELDNEHYRWTGVLARYADSGVDERTRMIPCIVEVADPEKVTRLGDGIRAINAPPTLLSGMFVSVRIRAKLARPLLRLPVSSVAPGGDVWMVDDRLQLRSTKVDVLTADDESVLVEQQPELEGARVVTSPLVSPINGMKAKIVDSPLETSLDPPADGSPQPTEEGGGAGQSAADAAARAAKAGAEGAVDEADRRAEGAS